MNESNWLYSAAQKLILCHILFIVKGLDKDIQSNDVSLHKRFVLKRPEPMEVEPQLFI